MIKPTLVAALIALAGAPAVAADYFLVVPVQGRSQHASGVAVGLDMATLPQGQVGTPYEYEFAEHLRVTGDPKFTGYGVAWSVSAGALPPGLTLDGKSGVMGGTPTGPGTSAFTIQAAYKTKSGTHGYQVVVAPAPIQLVLNAAGYRGWSDGTFSASCNEYRHPADSRHYEGDTGSGIYRVQPSGAAVDVYCDMVTDGGGWARVASAAGNGAAFPTTEVNDRGLQYREVLLAAAPDMFADFSHSPDFKFTGISPIDGLRFGATWHFLADTPAWRGYGASESSPYAISMVGAVGWANSNYTVVEQNPAGGSCRFAAGVQDSALCGRKVKVRVPGSGRLTGYNDLESLEGSTTDNNSRRNLELYVR
jgi:hypothetical protein